MKASGTSAQSPPSMNSLEAIEADILALLRELASARSEITESRNLGIKEKKVLLSGMIEVLDGFDRLFANIEPREATAEKQAQVWVRNFKSIRKLLFSHLEAFGVSPIEAPEGRAVPGLHTIVETRDAAGLADDTILEEILKGYLWRSEVLRKSEVIVVKN